MSAVKKIKVFVDGHCFDTAYQGTQTFVYGLYTALLKLDQVDIYFGATDTAAVRRAFPGLKNEKIFRYKKRRPSALRLLFDIPAILRNNRFDYAHFQYLLPMQVTGCKYILTMHDVLFNDFRYSFSWGYRVGRNYLFGYSLRRAGITTTVSAYSGQAISRNYAIPENQLHIVPNGVSTLFGSSLSAPVAARLIEERYGIRRFILYVSRLEPRKNHRLVLDSFLRLELYRQNISLVFIGEPSLPVPELQQAINSLTAEQQLFFHWIKQVEQEQLEWFYRSCLLFVYPSKAEGFGIPPLEAAVCKVPVLCSNATAMQDYHFFEPGTFDPGNPQQFESMLSEMIAAPPCTERLEKIAATVLEKYSWEKSAAAFFSLLEKNYQPWN